ncbi:MAG TPA: alpha/beta hydrolase [Allosphingosinicella sp.]|jgi:pimeloyl-ACP methyl ester carboxylesterase
MLLLTATLAAAVAAPPRLHDCSAPEIGRAECGIVEVPEGDGSRRLVRLDLLVLRAIGPERAADPVFVLQGGPGQAATPQSDFYARAFAPLRTKRDIYLIDMRGTGRSDSLHCAAGEAPRDFLPIAAVRACRAALEPRVRLSAYTTRRIVADLESIRRRFGLGPVNLYGTSYGTRVALEYMRLRPRSVRTATLSGVVSADNDAPASYGPFAQRASERYAALCREQPDCARAYPDPAGDLAKAQARAPAAGLDPGLFGELVRMELYTPATAGRLFGALAEAARGDFGFWKDRADRLGRFWSREGVSLGMFLSVTCADFMSPGAAKAAERLGAGTFAGAYRARQQSAACAEWPVPRTASGFHRPVRADVPVLLISGELDPVTPPDWSAKAARTLKRGRRVIIRHNGHALGAAAACVAGMMTAMVEAGRADRIDTGCADDLPPPKFSLGPVSGG